MKKLITAMAALAVCLSAANAADPAKKADADAKKAAHSPEDMFKKLDTNNDGSVSLEEFKVGKKDPAKAEEMFKKKDKNSDGKLTPEELSSGHEHGGVAKAAGDAAAKTAEPAPSSKASTSTTTTTNPTQGEAK